MDLLAQPALGADAERVADDQHADHQLGVDRRPPRLAVKGTQMLANARQVDEPVDRAQQVIRRDMILEAEAIKQGLLHHRPLAHHRPVSRIDRSIESDRHDNFKQEFFNTIGRYGTVRFTSAWFNSPQSFGDNESLGWSRCYPRTSGAPMPTSRSSAEPPVQAA